MRKIFKSAVFYIVFLPILVFCSIPLSSSAGIIIRKLIEGKWIEWRVGATPTETHFNKGLAFKKAGKLQKASEEFLETVTLLEDERKKFTGEKRKKFFETNGRVKAYRELVATLSERAIKGEKIDSKFTSYGKNLASVAFYFSELIKARLLTEAIVRGKKVKQKVGLPIPPEQLLLKDNEVLLEYMVGDDATYIFVVRKEGVKGIHRIALNKAVLEEKIRTFMKPLDMNLITFSIEKAKELYYILLANALYGTKGDEKVIIIPDGILGILPFEALVIKESKDIKDCVFVGDKWTISYAPSATFLGLTRYSKPEKTEKLLFALGDPVFSSDDPRYKAKQEDSIITLPDSQTRRAWLDKNNKTNRELLFGRLPETGQEVRQIAQNMSVVPEFPNVLLGLQANETELKKIKLEDYKYIHFATHSCLPGDIPAIIEPSLILGQVKNNKGDDGFLTLSEIMSINLNAELVSLSASCTGVGKIIEGEGVLSLGYAFLYAGARSVVVSLWNVPSMETVELMTSFYRHLKEGKSKAEALTLAKREIRVKYPNPFYWAPFVLVGER